MNCDLFQCKILAHTAKTEYDVNVDDLNMKNKMKNELKIAIYKSQREIHTVTARADPGDPGLKSHSKDYQQKLTSIRSPIQVPSEADVA